MPSVNHLCAASCSGRSYLLNKFISYCDTK